MGCWRGTMNEVAGVVNRRRRVFGPTLCLEVKATTPWLVEGYIPPFAKCAKDGAPRRF